MNRKTLIIIIVLVIAIAITGILVWIKRSKNTEENVIQPQ